MLEGLEASEIRYSYLAHIMRFDAEYFQKKYLRDEVIIYSQSDRFQNFADLGLSVDGSAFYPAIEQYYGQGTLPFLRVTDIKFIIDFENSLTLPQHICDELDNLKTVTKGDIVLTKGGSVARVGLITQKAATSRDLIFINSSKLAVEEQIFLFLYLFTDFCNRILLRSSSQTAQPHLTISLVRDIPILKASLEFKQKCLELITSIYEKNSEAVRLYKQAEEMLLEELGLAGWQPAAPLSYERQASELFNSGRWDAEYYQPATIQLLQKIQENNYFTLNQYSHITTGYPWASESFLEQAEDGEPFVRIRDCKPGIIDINNLSRLESKYANSQNQPKAQSGDLLVGMDGLKWFYGSLIKDACYVNQRVAWIQPQKNMPVSSEYLLLVINSLIGQSQLLREMTIANTVGHITNENIRQLVIPVVSANNHKEITDNIIASYNAQITAKQLLEKAKRAVEIAIEQNEEAALAFLETSIN